MELKDRISFDTTGLSQGQLDAFLKGLAFTFNVKNVDGSLNISDSNSLNQKLKINFANKIKIMKERAEEYEAELAVVHVDLEEEVIPE